LAQFAGKLKIETFKQTDQNPDTKIIKQLRTKNNNDKVLFF